MSDRRLNDSRFTDPPPKPPRCPRCGTGKAALCGQSVQHGPEERPGQPLEERELHTLAYQCECGLGFTQTVKRENLPAD